MPAGPGKYDSVATIARETTQAEGVVLAVINGKEGHGFAVQASLEITLALPDLLRKMADDIEEVHRRGEL